MHSDVRLLLSAVAPHERWALKRLAQHGRAHGYTTVLADAEAAASKVCAFPCDVARREIVAVGRKLRAFGDPISPDVSIVGNARRLGRVLAAAADLVTTDGDVCRACGAVHG